MDSLAKIEDYQNEAHDNVVTNKKLFSFLFQVFIYGTVVGTISLLVPMYALTLNASTVQVGLIAGSRGMGHFLLVVPVGILIDRFGIRKVFIISSVCSFFMIILFPFAKNPQVLFAIALLEGLTCSTRLTALGAWFFDLLPLLKPSQVGWYKGVIGIGTTIIGPITASLLAENIGFITAFILLAIIVLVVCIIELSFGSSTGAKTKRTEDLVGVGGECINLLKMLKNPRLLFVSYGESLNTAFTTCFRILIILLLVGFMHKSSGLVSIVTSCVGVSYLLVVFLGGVILKYLRTTKIYIISATIVSIALFILATNQKVIFIALASVLAGIGLGMLSLINYKTIGTIDGDSGKISGIVTFTTGVTMCMAPMIISCIVDMYSFKVGFFSLMVPFLLIIILAKAYERN